MSKAHIDVGEIFNRLGQMLEEAIGPQGALTDPEDAVNAIKNVSAARNLLTEVIAAVDRLRARTPSQLPSGEELILPPYSALSSVSALAYLMCAERRGKSTYEDLEILGRFMEFGSIDAGDAFRVMSLAETMLEHAVDDVVATAASGADLLPAQQAADARADDSAGK